ncbi:MAG: type II toxin-antitoxin system RelE/ParE family toxin [Gammaproteobacteria bacterium]|nr:MAG: type II toxin-antitoxin system RelE/ParE family toxin [Gammaproteobacteria bacterium]
MKLFYTPEAISDLQRLKTFIEVNNPLAAKKASLNLREGIDKLVTFPKIGLPVSKAPDPQVIRDLYVSNYTVRYLIQKQVITILRIWHNKENEKNHL